MLKYILIFSCLLGCNEPEEITVTTLQYDLAFLDLRLDKLEKANSQLRYDLDFLNSSVSDLKKHNTRLIHDVCILSNQNFNDLQIGNIYYAQGSSYKPRALTSGKDDYALIISGIGPTYLGRVKTLEEIKDYMLTNNYTTFPCD